MPHHPKRLISVNFLHWPLKTEAIKKLQDISLFDLVILKLTESNKYKINRYKVCSFSNQCSCSVMHDIQLTQFDGHSADGKANISWMTYHLQKKMLINLWKMFDINKQRAPPLWRNSGGRRRFRVLKCALSWVRSPVAT